MIITIIVKIITTLYFFIIAATIIPKARIHAIYIIKYIIFILAPRYYFPSNIVNIHLISVC